MSSTKRFRPSLRMLLGLLVGALLAGGIAQAATSASSAAVITETPPALTNSNSATFRFSGPKNAKFECKLDASTFAKCSSPTGYKNLDDGQHTFAVRVQGESSSASWTWTIDTVPPAPPVLIERPSDPTFNATNFFAWTMVEGEIYECSTDNGPFEVCQARYTWVIPTTNYGQRHFQVRARDAAGNASPTTLYRFKYEKQLPTEGLPFTITGEVDSLVIGQWQSIPLKVTNPNSVTLYVNTLTVTATNDPVGCTRADNLEIAQSDVSPTKLLAVPAGGEVTLPAAGVSAPRIRLKNLPDVNQDACKNKTFELDFTGEGTN